MNVYLNNNHAIPVPIQANGSITHQKEMVVEMIQTGMGRNNIIRNTIVSEHVSFSSFILYFSHKFIKTFYNIFSHC